MEESLQVLSYEWWLKLAPLRNKFCRESKIRGYEKDDFAQESYFILVDCLRKFDPNFGVPFESYYKIQLYGWRSNENRKQRDALLTTNGTEVEQEDEFFDLEGQSITAMLVEEVMEIIGGLTEEEQKLVVGYYLEDKQLKEIAEGLNLRYKTAEAKKRKALHKLYKILCARAQNNLNE